MAAKWFRLETDFTKHPKTHALRVALGDKRAGWYVVELFSWVSKYCPHGQFAESARAPSALAFESHAEWEGAPGALVDTLVEVGWLDRIEGGGFEVHDWAEQQSKVMNQARKWREQKAAQRARIKALKDAELSAGRQADKVPTGRDVTVRDVTDVESLSGDQRGLPLILEVTSPPDPALEVFGHWKAVMGSPRSVFDGKRRRAVEARLNEGRPVSDLIQAIDGCARTPHNMGQNDRSEKYNDLELICRNAPNVERFMRNATSPPIKPTSRGPVDPASQWTEEERTGPIRAIEGTFD